MATVMKKRKDELHENDQSAYQGCIGTAEFENAMMRVGERPYSQTAEAIQEMTRNTIAYCVARGVPSPEAFVKQASNKKKR